MEQMFQTHLDNTQMACRTGVPCWTEAPSLSVREMREQVWQVPSPRRGAGSPRSPSSRVRGFCSRRSRMEDVD